LIEHEADVNQVNLNGASPLFIAIYKNQREVAKFLLRQNANIESVKVLFRAHGKFKLLEILEKLCKEIEE